MKRNVFIKIHLVLAATILPVVLMYVITGALYTAEYKPSSHGEAFDVQLDAPLTRNVELLKSVVHKALIQRDIEDPDGKTKFKRDKKHGGKKFVWQGDNHTVSMWSHKDDRSIVSIEVSTPSWYKRLMWLHKAKASDAFDIFSIVVAIILIFVLITGVIVGLQVKLFRGLTLYSMGFGSLLFLAMMYISYPW
jgi:hypothetical protein